MGLQPFNEIQPLNICKVLSSGSGTGLGALVALGNVGVTRVSAIIVSTDDTVDRVLNVWYIPGSGTLTLLGSVTIPAGSGVLGVPAVDVVPLLKLGAYSGVVLPVADQIAVNVVTAITAGKTMWLTAMCGFV